MSAASRQRRYRERQREGLAELRVTVPLHGVVNAAIRSGFLTEEEALDRRNVERVAEGLLDAWADEWEKE